MNRHTLAALLGVFVLGLTGCSDEPTPAPTPEAAPSPSPSPSPTLPPLVPVSGDVTNTAVVDASQPTRLGFADDDGADEAQIDAAASSVITAVDAFLTAAQAGSGDLAQLGGEWLRTADPEAAQLLESGLATRVNPVASATYALAVHHEQAPTLVGVDVTVTRLDGTSQAVGLVFDVTTDVLQLQLVGKVGSA